MKKKHINKVAFIDEKNCIGCNKCVHFCNHNAIIGAKRMIHTIIKDLCTGCNLCVMYCPTDCITLIKIKNNNIVINTKNT